MFYIYLLNLIGPNFRCVSLCSCLVSVFLIGPPNQILLDVSPNCELPGGYRTQVAFVFLSRTLDPEQGDTVARILSAFMVLGNLH